LKELQEFAASQSYDEDKKRLDDRWVAAFRGDRWGGKRLDEIPKARFIMASAAEKQKTQIHDDGEVAFSDMFNFSNEEAKFLLNSVQEKQRGECLNPPGNPTTEKAFVAQTHAPARRGAEIEQPPNDLALLEASSRQRVVSLTKDEWNEKCWKVLQGLRTHRHGWLFGMPIDPDRILEKPMDFGTIDLKLCRGRYHSKDDFEADVYLTFDNAMTCCEEGCVLYAMAKELKAKFTFDYKEMIYQFLKAGPKAPLSVEMPKDQSKGKKVGLIQTKVRDKNDSDFDHILQFVSGEENDQEKTCLSKPVGRTERARKVTAMTKQNPITKNEIDSAIDDLLHFLSSSGDEEGDEDASCRSEPVARKRQSSEYVQRSPKIRLSGLRGAELKQCIVGSEMGKVCGRNKLSDLHVSSGDEEGDEEASCLPEPVARKRQSSEYVQGKELLDSAHAGSMRTTPITSTMKQFSMFFRGCKEGENTRRNDLSDDLQGMTVHQLGRILLKLGEKTLVIATSGSLTRKAMIESICREKGVDREELLALAESKPPPSVT
jgi:hypothetical protein